MTFPTIDSTYYELWGQYGENTWIHNQTYAGEGAYNIVVQATTDPEMGSNFGGRVLAVTYDNGTRVVDDITDSILGGV